jgi:hypothetical protein
MIFALFRMTGLSEPLRRTHKAKKEKRKKKKKRKKEAQKHMMMVKMMRIAYTLTSQHEHGP